MVTVGLFLLFLGTSYGDVITCESRLDLLPEFREIQLLTGPMVADEINKTVEFRTSRQQYYMAAVLREIHNRETLFWPWLGKDSYSLFLSKDLSRGMVVEFDRDFQAAFEIQNINFNGDVRVEVSRQSDEMLISDSEGPRLMIRFSEAFVPASYQETNKLSNLISARIERLVTRDSPTMRPWFDSNQVGVKESTAILNGKSVRTLDILTPKFVLAESPNGIRFASDMRFHFQLIDSKGMIFPVDLRDQRDRYSAAAQHDFPWTFATIQHSSDENVWLLAPQMNHADEFVVVNLANRTQKRFNPTKIYTERNIRWWNKVFGGGKQVFSVTGFELASDGSTVKVHAIVESLSSMGFRPYHETFEINL